jgi:hypothetical protein
MKRMRVSASLAVLVLLGGALTAQAGLINWDPSLPAPAPILDAGWAYDQVDALPPTPSVDSPYVYNLTAPAVFTITDDFVSGDTYNVLDFGIQILATSNSAAMAAFGAGDPTGWTTAGYYKGQILLAAGAHILEVTGNGEGGLSAGFYTRIDSVPEPGSLTLFGLGLGALCLLRLRKGR